MNARLSVDAALQNRKRNAGYAHWNHSPSSSEISTNPQNAARRIFDGFADIIPATPVSKVSLDSPVFTMGSCFAREIERALIKMHGQVVSMDAASLARPEFCDENGKPRSGFFHRFTPRSIWQELKIAFDEIPEWRVESSLIFARGLDLADFNYLEVKGMPLDLEAKITRRTVARELTRRLQESSLIILTLGLIESWVHKPTGLHCNRVDPKILATRKEEFELVFLDYDDTVACLNDIHDLIRRHHKTGEFHLVITVSPVPLQTTFSDQDIVIANEQSKCLLRTAAGSFCNGKQNVSYFPSYEIARFSNPAMAWRNDRVHVEPQMVNHIVRTFVTNYFETEAPIS